MSDNMYVDDLVEKIQAVLRQARRTCVNCVHFDNGSEGCALASGQRPPAVVIATGCPNWVGGPPF